MKTNFVRLVAVVLSLIRAQDACAQRAAINLSNYESEQPIFFWSGFGPTNRAPVAGTLVQVLGRPPDSGEFALIANDFRQTVFTLNEPGFFESSIGIVPNVRGGDPAELYIRAWRGAATWEDAIINPSAFVGQSVIFQNPTEGESIGGVPRSAPLINAPSFTIFPVPEPSTWALAVLGMIILWARWPKARPGPP